MVKSVGGQLLADAKAGDVPAFEALLRPAIVAGLQLAYHMLQDRAEAEDAVQEACLSAWRKLHQVTSESESLVPWFLSIVANRCRTTRRRRWWAVVKLPDIVPSRRSSELSVEHSYDLRQAIRALPEGQRSVLFLYFYMDLPLEQAARVLNVSPVAAKSNLHRPLRRLRAQLDPVEIIGE
jgi:RNA polymerase sigma-70 factor (ECF subfamily)